MVNNFNKVSALLNFESEDDFYFAQILKRKKEHPELGSNSDVVKTYFIKSLEELGFYEAEMICLADFHNARVGINLNRRSFYKTAFNTMKKVSDQIMNKDYRSVRKAYTSVCGAVPAEANKKWIIDVDHKDMFAINIMIDAIDTLFDPAGTKVIEVLETKNGYHLITSPFNVEQFKKVYPDVEIQKDNPTIMYIP